MFRAVASAEVASEPGLRETIDLKSLAAWETRVYQYDRAAAADFGFTMGSVKPTSNSRLLIMDTTRSKLTLPAIAAAMEVTALEASVRLEVKGYTGEEMWTVIPSPKPLDVDTYRTYMGAVEQIQKAFAEHPENAVPVLLAEGTVDILAGGISEVDMNASVLVVWALDRIRRGQSLADASGDLATSGPTGLGDEAAEVLSRTYEAILDSADTTTEPNDEAKLRAGSYLETLLVKR